MDQFTTTSEGRHTVGLTLSNVCLFTSFQVTREYFTASGRPIASPSSKSLANPHRLNTIVIENSGPNVSGMVLDFKVKITKPDGTFRNLRFGIEIPPFD